MTNADLLGFWADYGALALLTAGLCGVSALIAMVAWARHTMRPLRPIALAVSMNLALLLNAEGMWVIATAKTGLNLPPLFAVLVFAVFEICFLTATSLAAEQYRRTSVYRPDGTVASPGHPGHMLYVAALIAVLSGVVVASNAHSRTEVLLRLAVPCVIFLMWWAALTAAGQRHTRSRFAYSPRRLAERWGWLIPDEDPDLIAMAAARQVHRMVVAYQRATGKGLLARWGKSRLRKDARTASEQVVERVHAQLSRIDAVMNLLGPSPLGADEAEMEQRRAEVPARPLPRPALPASRAASQRAARRRYRSLRRAVCATHPVRVIAPAPEVRPDPRSTTERDTVIRALKAQMPSLKQTEIAHLVATTEPTVRRALRRAVNAGPTTRANGRKPDLASEGVR
ncbi:hypothetical protein Q0Z83_059820 [Actinoplanes sichuanensis]|uniref:Uncharacterized protein n=1 Tax=Actinoplanes sichuanensis TaxID=512349 RepID=A0ABW4A6Q5_9ACTN|nr:hypothetical protein [Actinoplanes sichuanensis]BEL07791.1 hypothetical protein Q0Z83_059820 [Actinoplanes sichuanensis]